ncbi:hypothetical protein OG21DRAFT_1515272 [Imleria badia]|nr:hypothetical protein OG21DRAFT_1515272 [Imleria badia]
MLTNTGKSALLLGGTGAVGKHLLATLLASPDWTRVGEYGRRVTTWSDSTPPPPKLEQKVIDFEDVEGLRAGMRPGRWDVVFVALGTTKASAGGAAQFERIDREYVVRACEAAKSDDPGYEQRVVYVSAANANATSPLLYAKSKGLTELALARLGYADTIIFRPAFLRGADRPDRRIAESVIGFVSSVVAHVSPHVEIEVSLLAKAMAKAGALGSSHIPPDVGATKVDAGQDTWFTVLSNNAAALLGHK